MRAWSSLDAPPQIQILSKELQLKQDVLHLVSSQVDPRLLRPRARVDWHHTANDESFNEARRLMRSSKLTRGIERAKRFALILPPCATAMNHLSTLNEGASGASGSPSEGTIPNGRAGRWSQVLARAPRPWRSP